MMRRQISLRRKLQGNLTVRKEVQIYLEQSTEGVTFKLLFLGEGDIEAI
jgi:hypothetical protein